MQFRAICGVYISNFSSFCPGGGPRRRQAVGLLRHSDRGGILAPVLGLLGTGSLHSLLQRFHSPLLHAEPDQPGPDGCEEIAGAESI